MKGLIKHLGLAVILAGASLFGGQKAIVAGVSLLAGWKAIADIAPRIENTVYTDQDYDLAREGKQAKYEWNVINSVPATDFFGDGVNTYIILDNLEARGLYDFTNKGYEDVWSFTGGSESNYFYNVGGAEIDSIVRGGDHRFTALIDEDTIKGHEEVDSYFRANNGSVSPLTKMQVPIIPEPSTLGLMGLVGAGAYFLRKKFS